MSYVISEAKQKAFHFSGQTYDGGVYLRGFDEAVIENCTIANADEHGIRIHNGGLFRITDSEISAADDGIYLTRVGGAIVENVKINPSSAPSSDCIQFSYENDDQNISRNIVLRGNILVQGKASTSQKGALVFAKSESYFVEHTYLEGKNFVLSSIGNGAVVRSCLMRHARLNKYSSGYSVGERYDLADHHVYDCVIEDCNRGLSLSAFDDKEIVSDGVRGHQRRDMVIHDTVFADCDIGFHADRAWSGAAYRNIFMRCKRAFLVQGMGRQTASTSERPGQFQGPIYENDGSFLNEEPPFLTRQPDGTLAATPGRWSTEPDEIRFIWRNQGWDLQVPPGTTTLLPPPAGEISCVVLARKGENWMLAIAETGWPANGFTPRAHTEGYLPWANRYFAT